ncbi:uncharacterized protein LOC144410327 [Gasterosteus aculeatus]
MSPRSNPMMDVVWETVLTLKDDASFLTFVQDRAADKQNMDHGMVIVTLHSGDTNESLKRMSPRSNHMMDVFWETVTDFERCQLLNLCPGSSCLTSKIWIMGW